MSGRDIIVIGASTGGVEAVSELVSRLPSDLPAAVFILIHIPPRAVSYLPEILNRGKTLHAAHAKHGEKIEHGRIYVAPPDQHMEIRGDHIELSRGPRENGVRPAIDPLFETAAWSYGPRVVGLLLTGYLGDGKLGIMVIKSRGGIAIVQDPNEAFAPSMPSQALAMTRVDYVCKIDQMPDILLELATKPLEEKEAEKSMSLEFEHADEIIHKDQSEQQEGRRDGETSFYTCPECGGVLWQVNAGELVHFKCHTGHAYSPESLMIAMSEDLEKALWSAIRTLKEKATLSRQVANRAWAEGNTKTAQLLEERAATDEKNVDILTRGLIDVLSNNGYHGENDQPDA